MPPIIMPPIIIPPIIMPGAGSVVPIATLPSMVPDVRAAGVLPCCHYSRVAQALTSSSCSIEQKWLRSFAKISYGMRFYGAGTHKVQPEKKWLLVDSSTLICMLESSVSISPTRLGQCKKCLNIQPNTFKIPRRFLDLQNPGFRLGIAKFAWNPFYLRRCPRSPGAEGGNRLEEWGVGGMGG